MRKPRHCVAFFSVKHLIVISGPTASGKTDLAIRLAKQLGCDIISADSRQVYHEMNIGTARPTKDEMQGITHHLLGHISVNQVYTAGQFAREARAILENAFSKIDNMILVGGTGLYIKALLEGIDRLPVEESIRNQVIEIWELGGLAALYQELEKQKIPINDLPESKNPRRMMRLLEWVLAGKPEETKQPLPNEWRVLKIGLEWHRDQLYERINQRVDLMMAKGLLEEARLLYPNRNLPALQTVGYQEIFDFFNNNCSLEQAVEKIKQHTRNYAKRQMTWLKKDPEIKWFLPENQAEAEAAVLAFSQGA